MKIIHIEPNVPAPLPGVNAVALRSDGPTVREPPVLDGHSSPLPPTKNNMYF